MGRQKIANSEKGRQKGGGEEAGGRGGEVEKKEIGAHQGGVEYEGYIHGVHPFVPLITICAPSDAAHSSCGRCARGCCISLHRESNRFVRFYLISVYRGSTRGNARETTTRSY